MTRQAIEEPRRLRPAVILAPEKDGRDRWIIDSCRDSSVFEEPRVVRAERRAFRESGDRSRRRLFVRATDAKQLYESAHYWPHVVISAPDIFVSLDPRRDPSTARMTCTIEAFFRYKAHVLIAREQRSLRRALGDCLRTPVCSVSRLQDPRLLPLHLYDKPDGDGELATEAGPQGFVRRHRKGSEWNGERERGVRRRLARGTVGVSTVLFASANSRRRKDSIGT